MINSKPRYSLDDVLADDRAALQMLCWHFDSIRFININSPDAPPKFLTVTKFAADVSSKASLPPSAVRDYSDFIEVLGCEKISDRGRAWEIAKGLGVSIDRFNSNFDRFNLIVAYSPRAVLIMALCNPNEIASKLRQDLGVAPQRGAMRGLVERAVELHKSGYQADLEKAEAAQAGKVVTIDFRRKDSTPAPAEKSLIPKDEAGISSRVKDQESKRGIYQDPQYLEAGVYVDASIVIRQNLTVIAVYNNATGEAEIVRREGIVPVNQAEQEAIALGARLFPQSKIIFTDNLDAYTAWKQLKDSPPDFHAADSAFAPCLTLYPVAQTDIEIRHVLRESNAIADHLTKLGREEKYAGQWQVEVIVNGATKVILKPLQTAAKSSEASEVAVATIAQEVDAIGQIQALLSQKEAVFEGQQQRIAALYEEIAAQETGLKPLEAQIETLRKTVEILQSIEIAQQPE